MHELTCSSILNQGMSEIKKMGIHSKGYAYVLGFICHYILDSECHPYVSEMMKYQKMGHLDIEGEFEKYLLLKDGHKPEAYRLDTLVQKQIDVLSIQRFYPELDVKDVENAIVWTRRCKKFVTAPHAWKRALITTGLKASGQYRSLKGVMLTPTLNSKAAMSNEGLYLRYQSAIQIAVDMLADYQESVVEDKPLNKRFDRNFE